MIPAIRVDNLSKNYTVGSCPTADYQTLREKIGNSATAAWHGLRRRLFNTSNGSHNESPRPDTFWALKDVSFEVQPGEVMGIVGRNGAGKSTLLKILSRIVEPTGGRCAVHGRMASLLEVGTGFHPELTGRENIYLNGSILGMRRKEIDRRFDDIVEFSEIGQFLDTPVKRYSSGMYVRLAFAVAAHLEPEILVVDEVLAVGDAQFQKKCLGMMQRVGKQGRTVLFVSHNMQAVQSLCDKAIWISEGRIKAIDDAAEVVARYLRSSEEHCTERRWEEPNTAPGNDAIRLRRIALMAGESSDCSEIYTSTPLTVTFEYWNLIPNTRLNISVCLYYRGGLLAFNTVSLYEPNWHGCSFPRGLFSSSFRIPSDLLNEGNYQVEVYFVKNCSEVLFRMSDVLTFEVKEKPRDVGEWMGRYPGVVRPKLAWITRALTDAKEQIEL